MDTLDFIVKKFGIDVSKESSFELNCCRLRDLPGLYKELGFATGVEVGVLEGVFSEILCQSNPDLKVYSVDAWEFYPVHKNFRRSWMYPAIYEKAVARLAPYKNNEIIRKWSADAVNDFADESLDFVFIDGNHAFEYITEDISKWGKKVRKGGIISGHDFGDSPRSLFCSVETVVRAWTKAKKIHPWFILNSPHSAKERSWMWVKQ
jgi:Methyltransferase domain